MPDYLNRIAAGNHRFVVLAVVLRLLFLQLPMAAQITTLPLTGQLSGDILLGETGKMGDDCFTNGQYTGTHNQNRFAITPTTLYQADNAWVPNYFTQKWAAPLGPSIINFAPR